MLRFGSLFSGIGGFDRGFEQAGYDIRWQIDSSEFCRRVLAKHWPDVPRFGDIRSIEATELEPVDVVAGGFPCQPTSTIGEREGTQDERWLWPEFARIIRGIQPRYVVMENPTGILVRGLDVILAELAQCGYDAEWAVLHAGLFGARHKRDRTFILAYPTKLRLEGGNGSAAQRRTPPVLRASALPESPVRWDISEPPVCRTSHGVPDRVDRTRALGNAVVPQIAHWIAQQILDHGSEYGTAQAS